MQINRSFMRLQFLVLFLFIILCSCHTQQSNDNLLLPINLDANQSPYALPVKSILLYDTIHLWSIDTIQSALEEVNAVIATIESREAGYSLWKVQSDTISSYRYFVQGHWPDQASYDSIHVNPSFRKVLDDYVHIFTETRKWDLYRRYQLIE